MQSTEVVHIFVLFFLGKKLCINFDKNGYISGDFVSKKHLVTLIATVRQCWK
jgi:hypothetical protein